jgi:hypothetical protein
MTLRQSTPQLSPEEAGRGRYVLAVDLPTYASAQRRQNSPARTPRSPQARAHCRHGALNPIRPASRGAHRGVRPQLNQRFEDVTSAAAGLREQLPCLIGRQDPALTRDAGVSADREAVAQMSFVQTAVT